MQPNVCQADESKNIPEQFPEKELVEQACRGDREAFGELVRRHRDNAVVWASVIAQDAYTAEDIVQEALIRAFLYLGTLTNAGSFRPWFKRIVRNQAMMRVRRGGLYGRELPFTSVVTPSVSWDQADWQDIDSSLFHLSKSAAERAHEQDPSFVMMRKDIVESIRTLVYCLSPRERAIFEAYFFRHLSVHELAERYDTSKANIYILISRSRKKVQKERIRKYFKDSADLHSYQ